ncbi:hypothetical protein ACVWWO_008650 [Bradyrhizobium sp. F1.13.1]
MVPLLCGRQTMACNRLQFMRSVLHAVGIAFIESPMALNA